MPARAKALRTKEEITAKKLNYIGKVQRILEEYPRFLVVTCDNIGSSHMQRIRLSLRGTDSVILMGKNTLMRRAIKSKVEEHPEWETILPALKGNAGLIFTKGSLKELEEKVLDSTVPAVAKAGAIAPIDVVLPKQITTLEPTKTSFFAALDIATKITKGCVEILNDVKLCELNKKVGSSESALLAMLEIKPFKYGLIITNCYDGYLFPVEFMAYQTPDLIKSINVGITNVAALSLALSVPTIAAFPHMIVNGFKNLVAVALETKYSFKEAETIKNRVENPETYAPKVEAVVQPTPQQQPKQQQQQQPKVPDKKVSSSSSSSSQGGDDLMGFF